jgi:hypothetical protein
MKSVIFSFIFLMCTTGLSFSQKYIDKTGHIWFYSHTPVEDIEAHNRQTTSILDTKTGELIFQVLIKSFEFQRSLMEEHFNENYMESDKFPKASFKGQIINIASIDLTKNGTYSVDVEGDLTIHGVTKKISTKGTLEVKDGKIAGKSKFEVIPQDFGIQIPDLVKDKFAKQMDVTVEMNYELMQ